MRHRYHSCCNRLEELLTHPSFQVKVSLEDLDPASPLISKVLHKAEVGAVDVNICFLVYEKLFYLDFCLPHSCFTVWCDSAGP